MPTCYPSYQAAVAALGGGAGGVYYVDAGCWSTYPDGAGYLPPPEIDPPVPVAQLYKLAVSLYGHSNALVPFTSYTTGHHWSAQIADSSRTASFAALGVGGATMEATANLFGGAPAATRWDPVGKALAIVHATVNSALSTPTNPLSVQSCANGAEFMMARATSTEFREDNVLWTYNGTWATQALALGSPIPVTNPAGIIVYLNGAGYAQMTVPAGYANRAAWWSTVSFSAEVGTCTITVNGVPVYSGPTAPAADTVNGTKIVRYCGKVTTGDVIRITRNTGFVYHDGLFIDSGLNHCAVTGDPSKLPVGYPDGAAATAKIKAHNLAVKAKVESVQAVCGLDAVSYLDLDRNPYLDFTTMLWSGDNFHANDRGQAWYAQRIARALADTIPWTPRLHTI